MDFRDELEAAVLTGLFDKSNISSPEYQPKILVNNREEKILTSIINELRNCDSFCFSVAFVTNGGIAVLYNVLNDLCEKGISGKILVSKYLNFTEPRALKRLIGFENLEIRVNENDNHHAKGFIFNSNSVKFGG